MYTDNPSLSEWLVKKFGTNEWPSYNIADSALVVGVGLFLVHYLFLEEKEEAPKKADAPPQDGPPDAKQKVGAEGA